ncbi:hypothetical protein [Fulvimonas yonginensis]|uniref:Uncharacterized protein n=1 Tax=Fulvimonas yonginensis TaxID=1495200 RepID=A0ABU8JBY1_9GAMM
MRQLSTVTLVSALLLSGGCAQAPDAVLAAATAAGTPVVDRAAGIAIAVPQGMHLRRDFRRDYLGDAGWKAFADADGHGRPVLALVLDGSDAITTAELRIGMGSDAQALAHCRDVPPSGVAPEASTVTLDGVPFLRFHAADAAMSHYREVEAYHAVHAGRCYAIDLLLTGTRPEVYDPPATPPFDRVAAKVKLQRALASLRFTE